MSDNWDFSSLLASWTEKPTENSEQPSDNNNDFAEIQEQMQKELDEIQSQLVLLRSNDPTILNELNLLSPPIAQPPQVITEKIESQNQIQVQNQTPSRSSTSLAKISNINKNSISSKSISSSKLPPLTKSSLGPLPKPKEAMLMKPKRTIVQKTIPKPEKIFKATPNELKIVNFTLSKEYVMTFTLQNVSSRTQGFQINGPKDPAFRFKILENVNNPQIRPGLHLTFEVTFIPTEPRDYESTIIILPGPNEQSTAIPIRCYRDPPQLILNDIVDLQATLVHSSISGSFTITNRGGIAFFSFSSIHGREDSMMYIDGPFTLTPSQFQLERGQSIEINVKFKPTVVGLQKASFEINAQYFPQKFYFITQALAAVPRLRFKICDDDRLLLPFLPSDANSTRAIEIYNDSDVSYPFYIQIVRPKESTKSELKVLFPETEIETVKTSTPFSVKPSSGFIGARDTISLKITFSPKMFAFFRANLVIFAHRIPDEAGVLGSRKMLTVSAEATAGRPCLSVIPPLVIFSDVVPRVLSKQTIEVQNESSLTAKLQWRKSDIISPSPVVFEVGSKQKESVELCFFLSRSISSLLPSSLSSIFWKNSKKNFLSPTNNDDRNLTSHPSSQNYAISFSPLLKRTNSLKYDQTSPVKTPSDNDDMNSNENVGEINGSVTEEMNDLGLPSTKMRKFLSYKESRAAFAPSPKSVQAIDDQDSCNASGRNDQSSSNSNFINQMKFTYSANVMDPNLIVEPPVLEFGCVLIGQKGIQKLHLINPTECPIGYTISYPQTGDWIIEKSTGIVETELDLTIEISHDSQDTLSDFITIKTFWTDEDGSQIESLPTSLFDVPVFAVFDKPFISIENRIINIGEVFPTLEYKSMIKISLLNTFPTNFTFEGYSSNVCLTTRPLTPGKTDNQTEEKVTLTDRSSAPITIRSKSQIRKKNSMPKNAKEIQRASTVTLTQRSERLSPVDNENDTENEKENLETNESVESQSQKVFNVVEYVRTDPVCGRLEFNESCEVNIYSNFCKIGDLSLPFVCNIMGNSYTCVVLAHVKPPKLSLKTPTIDFSSDFIICKRSSSFVVVENECGVPSTVRLEMEDDCNGVFSLDDDTTKEVSGEQKVEIPISCYSEIHGDYHGKLKLIVKDSWQRKEISIPLHVKALGSFFGFMKHTLGYEIGNDGDFVSFGKKIKVGSQKVVRRITLENFSSDEITVSWSLVNLVKGRHYVDVALDVDDSGFTKIDVTTTAECELMEPFKLLTEKTVIESHSKTVVIVEFTPSEVGEFRGCVAAKSGEFVHTLDLVAIVCN